MESGINNAKINNYGTSPLTLKKSANSPVSKHFNKRSSLKNSNKLAGLNQENSSTFTPQKPALMSSNMLVQQLLPKSDFCPIKEHIFTVLLNIRTLSSPQEILDRLLNLIFREKESAKLSQSEYKHLSNNVVNFLLDWSDYFPYDFARKSASDLLKTCLELCCSMDNDLRMLCIKLSQNLKARISKLDRYERALIDLRISSTLSDVLATEAPTGLLCRTCSPKIVAQQLAHIELERLSMIGPEEFVYALSKSFSNEKSVKQLLEADLQQVTSFTRNIEHYIEWCNRLSYLVATEICKNLKKKNRIKVIEFFIDVAQQCFNMGNFNSMVAISGAFESNACKRLKKTWSKVINKNKWSILERQTDPGGNFSSYRSTLKAAVWRSEEATGTRGKIVIPAFGVLFKDFMALYEHYKPFLQSDQVNINIFAEFTSQMQTFLHWKEADCPFERNDEVLLYLLTSPVYDETALQLASFDCESPDNAAEKEMNKKLRTEVKYNFKTGSSNVNESNSIYG